MAEECEAAMAYRIKTYVDEMDDAVMTTYVAWPERLYLVGGDARIVYAGESVDRGGSNRENWEKRSKS